VVLLILAALALFVCNPVTAQLPNNAPYPPPGELVDVGGYRVHIYRTGEGSPAVVIVGAGFSFDWGLVEPEAASKTLRISPNSRNVFRTCIGGPSPSNPRFPPSKQLRIVCRS